MKLKRSVARSVNEQLMDKSRIYRYDLNLWTSSWHVIRNPATSKSERWSAFYSDAETPRPEYLQSWFRSELWFPECAAHPFDADWHLVEW